MNMHKNARLTPIGRERLAPARGCRGVLGEPTYA
jgi:hypothetical protein